MRIISGSAKGRKLASFNGSEIRPTADRVREALFSILLSRLGTIQGCRVLDLYAGTGALGIEALSRGAGHCTFIDQAKAAVSLVRRNLEHVGLADRGTIIAASVETRLSGLSAESFDLVFVDPPYADPGIGSLVARIAEARLLAEGGLLCLETAVGAVLPDAVGQLERCDRRTYGTTMISLYRNLAQGVPPS